MVRNAFGKSDEDGSSSKKKKRSRSDSSDSTETRPKGPANMKGESKIIKGVFAALKAGRKSEPVTPASTQAVQTAKSKNNEGSSAWSDRTLRCKHPLCSFAVHSDTKVSWDYCCKACQQSFDADPKAEPNHGKLCEKRAEGSKAAEAESGGAWWSSGKANGSSGNKGKGKGKPASEPLEGVVEETPEEAERRAKRQKRFGEVEKPAKSDAGVSDWNRRKASGSWKKSGADWSNSDWKKSGGDSSGDWKSWKSGSDWKKSTADWKSDSKDKGQKEEEKKGQQESDTPAAKSEGGEVLPDADGQWKPTEAPPAHKGLRAWGDD
mmetsp:Transcript_46839/g.111453  ORF Transcript_46839/g.111453 Transcript_46839/m.111453 type:complete len:321 (-) Transcript_46839:127-1089(-)